MADQEFDQFTQTKTAIPARQKVADDMMMLDSLGNPLGTASSPLVTSSAKQALASAGKAFVASSGTLTLGVSGNVRVLFTNPLSSGVSITVASICATTSTALVLGQILTNVTAGPTTAGVVRNAQVGGTAPKALIFADTNSTAMTGTTFLPIPITAGRTVFDQTAFMLSPGQTLGFNFPYTSVGGTAELQIHFTEVALG